MPTTKDNTKEVEDKVRQHIRRVKDRPEDYHHPSKVDKNKKEKSKPPKDFRLIKAIREDSLYKNNIVRRDKQVRKYVDENLDVKGKLSYYHPKVNIEGENYILKIIAKK